MHDAAKGIRVDCFGMAHFVNALNVACEHFGRRIFDRSESPDAVLGGCKWIVGFNVRGAAKINKADIESTRVDLLLKGPLVGSDDDVAWRQVSMDEIPVKHLGIEEGFKDGFGDCGDDGGLDPGAWSGGRAGQHLDRGAKSRPFDILSDYDWLILGFPYSEYAGEPFQVRDRKGIAVFLKRKEPLGFAKQMSCFFQRRFSQAPLETVFVEQRRFKREAFVSGVARFAKDRAVRRLRFFIKEERHKPTFGIFLCVTWIYKSRRE